MSAAEAALYTGSPADAALDVAVSHALLRDAAGRGEAMRVWIPPPALSFGRLDLLLPTRSRAIEAARAQGLAPVRRLAGGRAAPIGPGTVCLGWGSRSAEPAGMQMRYRMLADVIVGALAGLGIRARVGELEGEWCPGAWSVIAGGRKVGGLAQRVIRGAAWAEAVVVVTGADALARALDRVLDALEIPWQPATFGGLADADPAITVERAASTLVAGLGEMRAMRAQPLPPALWAEAERLRSQHAL